MGMGGLWDEIIKFIQVILLICLLLAIAYVLYNVSHH